MVLCARTLTFYLAFVKGEQCFSKLLTVLLDALEGD